jgi:hypothetical protein
VRGSKTRPLSRLFGAYQRIQPTALRCGSEFPFGKMGLTIFTLDVAEI